MERRARQLGSDVDPDPLDPQQALSLLVVALTMSDNWSAWEVARSLVARRLPYTLDDTHLLVQLAEEGSDHVWMDQTRARAALSALELRAAEGDDVAALAARVLEATVSPHTYDDAGWTRLAGRARRLNAALGGGELDLSVLRGDDSWSEHVRPLVSARFQSQGELLEQLAGATQSRPSRRWLAKVEPLLAGEQANELVRLLLTAAAEVEPRRVGSMVFEGREYFSYLWLSDMSATVVRGALWAASLLRGSDWVVSLCARLIERAIEMEGLKVGNACFYCLGERADDQAVALLGRYVAQLKDRRVLKPAQAALERAAAKRGITSEQLRERLVPSFGLDTDGRAVRAIGSAQATPALGADARKELAVQRVRLEALLAADRSWEYDDWRRFYLEHPLVGLLTRRLIWLFGTQPAIPLARDRFLTLESEIDPPQGETVRLWHPLQASTDEIAAWRALLMARELRQPFKQAHREIYLLAPAERETRLYSNRFAAHIVRYKQVYALAKQRGWGIRALGPYDNDGGEQWRDFPAHDLRASFWMDPVDVADNGMIAELASTDQVRFSAPGEDDPLALEEIPPLVFSEAMRDVDLFVGVASIAADPTWIDGGADRFHAYWHEYGFGELSQAAEVRHEVLAQLLPGLKISEQLELEDRFLRVHGQLHTYKIHLGSANVLVEPDDRYLCIVPARRARAGKLLFLPFEDERLSTILSKALLLAADDRITDSTILAKLSASRRFV